MVDEVDSMLSSSYFLLYYHVLLTVLPASATVGNGLYKEITSCYSVYPYDICNSNSLEIKVATILYFCYNSIVKAVHTCWPNMLLQIF